VHLQNSGRAVLTLLNFNSILFSLAFKRAIQYHTGLAVELYRSPLALQLSSMRLKSLFWKSSSLLIWLEYLLPICAVELATTIHSTSPSHSKSIKVVYTYFFENVNVIMKFF
jgi:hypothetical protein